VTLTIGGAGLCAEDVAFVRRTVRRSAVFNLFALARETAVEVRVEEAVGLAA
jgi:hypothetical protein